MRRALLAVLLAYPVIIGASEPDLIETRIRGLIEINAKTNGICEVHHVHMERRLVPVAFGLPVIRAEYWDAMQRDFPHSLAHIEGGCVTDAKFLHVRLPWYVCPECKRAEHQWAQKHSDTPEGKTFYGAKMPFD